MAIPANRPKRTSKKKKMEALDEESHTLLPVKKEPTELTAQNPAPSYEQYLERARQQNAARSWMWVGVVSVATMIIILWGWAMKSKMDTLNWRKAPEKQLFEKTRAEWGKVFSDNQDNTEQLGQTKEDLKGALQQILTATSSGTVAPSSTTSTIK
ncbi:MAG TPA: hypothetical protein VJA27_02840 [Patescibacteria group bacterium]|nr:hypothetical protein [Patescibacteria group bacterium]